MKTMKNQSQAATLLVALLLPACAAVQTQTGAHTPPSGSAERNAILVATQHAYNRHGMKNAVLDVATLKVHSGWAWIQINPRSANGKQHYESQSGLLQEKATKWTFLEWMPAEEGTDYPKYFKNLKAKYPAAPADIFPQ
jgi:hypothetical protein